MQKIIIELPEIKLIGITARTNNSSEIEPTTAKIGATLQKYFHNGLSEKISNRKNPGVTYCAYTNYERDFTGDYTYFIGEAVTSFDGITSAFESLHIPAQLYAKLTNGPGKMPDVCIQAWKQVWMMPPHELGGERSYITDFEIYDERSQDQQNAIFDICIGIRANQL